MSDTNYAEIYSDQMKIVWAIVAGCALIAATLFFTTNGSQISGCAWSDTRELICVSKDGNTLHSFDRSGSNHFIFDVGGNAVTEFPG